MMMETILRKKPLFLHIPKTAGTSVLTSIGDNYPRHKIKDYPSDADMAAERMFSDFENYEFFYGHGFLDRTVAFNGKFFVFTVLRRPLDRFLSAYFHARRTPEIYTEQFPERSSSYFVRLAQHSGPEEFLDRLAEQGMAESFVSEQTRILSLSRLCRVGFLTPTQMEEVYASAEQALPNLGLAGTVDQLKKLMAALADAFEWMVPEQLWNENKGDYDKTVSPSLRAKIERYSIWDDRLFDKVHADFEANAERVFVHSRRLRALRKSARALRQSGGIWVASDAVVDEGWHEREMINDTPYRWAGRSEVSTLSLWSSPGLYSRLEVTVINIPTPEILRNCRIGLNGKLIDYAVIDNNNAVVVLLGIFENPEVHGGIVELALHWGHRIRPSDIDPASENRRLVSLAISKITLESFGGDAMA